MGRKLRYIISLVVTFWGAAGLAYDASAQPPLSPVFKRTAKICQLTGNVDRQDPRSPTGMVIGGGSRGLTGTDIGWSFDYDNRLNFMFGDTRDFNSDRCDPGACGVRNNPISVFPPLEATNAVGRWKDYTGPDPQALTDPDNYWDWLDTHGDSSESWASAPAGSNPASCLPLAVAADETGKRRSTFLNGRTMPRQEGVFSGFAAGSNIYGFITRKSWPVECASPSGCAHDDHSFGGKTALALSRDGGATFDEIYHFSTTLFQFVAPSVQSVGVSLNYPLTFWRRKVVFAFGAGRLPGEEWNSSYPYLAISRADNVWGKVPSVDGVAAFAHVLGATSVGNPVALSGPAIGLAPEDKRIIGLGDKALVIRSDGHVWYQTISLSGVGAYTYVPPRVQPDGYIPLVGANPQDRWVVPDSKRGRVLVITNDGRVFAHKITDHVEAPILFWSMFPVASRPEDNHVLVVGDRIVVITKRGIVYAHPMLGPEGNALGTPTMLSNPANPDTLISGTTPPGTPEDRWVFAIGDTIYTVKGEGRVVAHRITTGIEAPQPLSGFQKVGWSDYDRWLIPIETTLGSTPSNLLAAVSYKPSKFLYFAGLKDGRPDWKTDEAKSIPLWGGPHKCLGYYSVRFVPSVNRWLALYTCSIASKAIRGVFLRSAIDPWGPWSSPTKVMMSNDTENPYCKYMHLPADIAVCAAGLSNPFEEEKRVPQWDPSRPGRRNVGGEYAPFLLPSNYQKLNDNGTMSLYFTLSTWNPYQTVLMKTVVKIR